MINPKNHRLCSVRTCSKDLKLNFWSVMILLVTKDWLSQQFFISEKFLEALFMGTPLIKVLLVGLRQATKKKESLQLRQALPWAGGWKVAFLWKFLESVFLEGFAHRYPWYNDHCPQHFWAQSLSSAWWSRWSITKHEYHTSLVWSCRKL